MVAERAARLTTKKWCSADAPGFATLPLGYNAETSPFFARWYAKKAWRLLYSDLLTRILAGSPYPARVSHPSVPSVQRSAGLEDSAAGKQVAHGVLNCDGSIDTPSCGTPQGGVISPILANIYLHFVLDRWFDGDVKKNSNGEAHMVRYADDFTAAFRYHRNAARFLRRLPSRLGKFSLKLAPDKTRKLMFNRFRKSEIGVFSFLGFEFRWIST
ncbi:MAG: hypothetical protein JXB48_23385, partial [Candidatus Latescibacteria bacterium]|nr:hypothetical protein [Candidatus Latescibacterota bacterium]